MANWQFHPWPFVIVWNEYGIYILPIYMKYVYIKFSKLLLRIKDFLMRFTVPKQFFILMGLGFCNISSIGHILSYLSTSWSSSPHSIRSANLYTISSCEYLQSFAVMHETIKCVQIFLTHLRNFPNCILSDHPRNELLENMLNSSLKVSCMMMQYIFLLVKTTGYSY